MSDNKTKHADQAKQRDLDFMRRYAEAVLMQAAKDMNIKVRIEPGVLAEVPLPSGGSHEIVSHKVWMNSDDTDHAQMVAQMAYWSDAVPQDPPATGGTSNSCEIEASDTPAQKVAKKLEKTLRELGFETGGTTYDNGFPQGFSEYYKRGHPAVAGVCLKGSLNELVRKAKATQLGKYVASDPALGQS